MSDFDPLAEPEEHYCKWHADDDDCPDCGECIECGMCDCGADDDRDEFYDDNENESIEQDGYA